ncbi:hypothetical protein [Pseudomonas sp. 5P_5.1_Bac1]|uniref:hypothetical protein n=1 Tax=Pseudomonas sp. 5P_5.1_Bac1 TaxID=2971616 RepID=UPI0021C91DDC|nr:hypothetical protein [Pseudomonas sp. 5P_5.1_Bac1]MCU1722961.1 hypothetical protein [Pseudomonas sp. 5P_5.1_Bac1]
MNLRPSALSKTSREIAPKAKDRCLQEDSLMVSRRIPSAKQDLSDRAISHRKKGPQDNACPLTRSGRQATPKPSGTTTGEIPLRIHRFYRDKGIQKREDDGTGNAA